MSYQFEEKPLLDDATIVDLWELDAGSGFMQELIPEFNLQNRRLMQEIFRAAVECDFEALRFSVHTMKGSSSNVGAFRQAAIALTIENACKAADCETIKALMPALAEIAEATEDSAERAVVDSHQIF